jgi:hypothetical protein
MNNNAINTTNILPIVMIPCGKVCVMLFTNMIFSKIKQYTIENSINSKTPFVYLISAS